MQLCHLLQESAVLSKKGTQFFKKNNKALELRQKVWLEAHIWFNAKKKKTAFEEDFFRLMNNAVYGKTMENLQKRKNILLINTEEKARKAIA